MYIGSLQEVVLVLFWTVYVHRCDRFAEEEVRLDIYEVQSLLIITYPFGQE
jgi:hypothetical protein